jgi:uncharacterized RDD family membrane protein YckC
MSVRQTQTLVRMEAARRRPPATSRAVPLRRARAVLRLIAYLVDWLVTVIITSILVSIGGLQLYIASDRGTQEAPDTAAYAFVVITLLIVPIWLVMTLAGWSVSGRSVGKLAAGLKIVDRRGRPPGFFRSFLRLIVYVLENAPLVVGPGVFLLWAVSDEALPAWALPVAGFLFLLAVATLLPAVLSSVGRPLHDLVAGTTVVEE